VSDLLTQRKDHHVDIVLEEAVVAPPAAVGLGHYTLEYDALPEVNLEDVDLSVEVFGCRLSAPLVIGAMTGGTGRTGDINRTLARAAARVGLGMALGSQRAMIVHPDVAASFDVRDAAPDLPLLFGNVGAVQLNYGVGVAEVAQAIERVGADVLNLHLNPLQEAIQPEGDTRFAGLAQKIGSLASQLDVPVVVKEVGAGISARAAAKLARLPIAGVEVAGVGGTSWAAVESYRTQGDEDRAEVGRRLAGFGVPTAESIPIVCRAMPDRVVIASGGLRHGMDLAVSLAMGATLVASARPFLQAAMQGEDAVVAAMQRMLFELKVICFCCGVDRIDALREVRVVDLRRGYPLES
jgi:isopentenyl-diphosphate delta-isomerase